jgi:hypothetical protein
VLHHVPYTGYDLQPAGVHLLVKFMNANGLQLGRLLRRQ